VQCGEQSAERPLIGFRVTVPAALDTVLDEEFDATYATSGRPSVPPERLWAVSVLMATYSMRSERVFRERLDDDMLFKGVRDLPIDAASSMTLVGTLGKLCHDSVP